MRRAIVKHLRDFVAILFVAVVGLGVAGYILSNQRFYLPNWVPVVGSDFYNVQADLGTAQAVVPGQGQSVNIAGVKVGDIGKVKLVDGHARVEMKIKRKYAPIYRDASVLLRPKTGLKDMYLELDPGNSSAGKMPANGRVPISNTLPDVNPDEFLSALDTDTRDYLRVLLNSGAEALQGDSPASLRATLKRFEPTGRDVKAITSQLATRRRNVSRVIHNFQELATALGQRDRQLSGFVDSSNANFEAIASQEQNLRRALQLFPGTLTETRDTLVKVDDLATQLGPALRKLRPAARALGPAQRQTRPFLRATTPVIKNEIRPFARSSRPAIKELRTTARSLAPVAPRLQRSFSVLNTLFNTLTYNPPGAEEGYLFWASWLNHTSATLFGTQDGNGPIRRGLVFVNCGSLQVLENLKAQNPRLGTLIELLNAPKQTDVCPAQTPTPVAGATP